MRRTDLRAWVRYDKGRVISSSLVLRRSKPAGNFKELVDPATIEVCCPFTFNSGTIEIGCPGEAGLEYFTLPLGPSGNTIYPVVDPDGLSIQDLVTQLNLSYPGFASFAVNEDGVTIDITLIVDTYRGIRFFSRVTC